MATDWATGRANKTWRALVSRNASKSKRGPWRLLAMGASWTPCSPAWTFCRERHISLPVSQNKDSPAWSHPHGPAHVFYFFVFFIRFLWFFFCFFFWANKCIISSLFFRSHIFFVSFYIYFSVTFIFSFSCLFLFSYFIFLIFLVIGEYTFSWNPRAFFKTVEIL